MRRCRRPQRAAPQGRAALKKRSAGFSLIEILAAFTLLAVFIATAFQVYTAGLRSTARAGDYARAQTLARSRLDTLAAAPVLEPGEESGQVTAHRGARVFRWRTTLTDYPLPDYAGRNLEPPAPPLLAVVEVAWDGDSMAEARHRFRLSALLLGRGG